MSKEQKKQTSIVSDAAVDALSLVGTAAGAVIKSVGGARTFVKVVRKCAADSPKLLKLEGLSGLIGMELCAEVLLKGDFIPTLAQAIDRAWEKHDTAKAVVSAPKVRTSAPKEVVSAIAEAPVEVDAVCSEDTVEETVCEPVEETVAEAIPAMTAEAMPVPCVETPCREALNESEDGDEEDGDFLDGISLVGVSFFDAAAQPEAYAALLEQEGNGEIRIVTRYRRSFLSRLIQSQGEVQEYYSILKNKLLSYKGVKGRISWGNETFKLGRDHIAKINVKSRTIYLYLALDPATVSAIEDGKYSIEDVSAMRKYQNVPVLFKLQGPRKLKYALELIELLCDGQMKLPPVKRFTEVDYVVPYQTTAELVEEGSIHRMVAGVPVSAFLDAAAEHTN